MMNKYVCEKKRKIFDTLPVNWDRVINFKDAKEDVLNMHGFFEILDSEDVNDDIEFEDLAKEGNKYIINEKK